MLFLMLLKQNWQTCHDGEVSNGVAWTGTGQAPPGSEREGTTNLVAARTGPEVPIRQVELFDT